MPWIQLKVDLYSNDPPRIESLKAPLSLRLSGRKKADSTGDKGSQDISLGRKQRPIFHRNYHWSLSLNRSGHHSGHISTGLNKHIFVFYLCGNWILLSQQNSFRFFSRGEGELGQSCEGGHQADNPVRRSERNNWECSFSLSLSSINLSTCQLFITLTRFQACKFYTQRW